jgi:hypothetical protein
MPENSQISGGEDFPKKSGLYKDFQEERDEILKYKWVESEKAGYDIGFERALTDWTIKHRSKWRKSRQTQSSEESFHDPAKAQEPELDLYFEGGAASQESLQRVLVALSRLHIAVGGPGLEFYPGGEVVHVRERIKV